MIKNNDNHIFQLAKQTTNQKWLPISPKILQPQAVTSDGQAAALLRCPRLMRSGHWVDSQRVDPRKPENLDTTCLKWTWSWPLFDTFWYYLYLICCHCNIFKVILYQDVISGSSMRTKTQHSWLGQFPVAMPFLVQDRVASWTTNREISSPFSWVCLRWFCVFPCFPIGSTSILGLFCVVFPGALSKSKFFPCRKGHQTVSGDSKLQVNGVFVQSFFCDHVVQQKDVEIGSSKKKRRFNRFLSAMAEHAATCCAFGKVCSCADLMFDHSKEKFYVYNT